MQILPACVQVAYLVFAAEDTTAAARPLSDVQAQGTVPDEFGEAAAGPYGTRVEAQLGKRAKSRGAGSETTATLLCGVTNYLLKNPDVLQILVDEIWGIFSAKAVMAIHHPARLPYLSAVIEEGF